MSDEIGTFHNEPRPIMKDVYCPLCKCVHSMDKCGQDPAILFFDSIIGVGLGCPFFSDPLEARHELRGL